MFHEAGFMHPLLIILILGLFSSQADADDWASVAFTGGIGRLEVVTDYWIFSSGKSHEAHIPRRIQEGTRIRISYEEDGKLVKTDFFVAGISTKGDLCHIHNKLPSQYSTSVGDTIYVKPCRYQ